MKIKNYREVKRHLDEVQARLDAERAAAVKAEAEYWACGDCKDTQADLDACHDILDALGIEHSGYSRTAKGLLGRLQRLDEWYRTDRDRIVKEVKRRKELERSAAALRNAALKGRQFAATIAQAIACDVISATAFAETSRMCVADIDGWLGEATPEAEGGNGQEV
jgi:hypothetical protein